MASMSSVELNYLVFRYLQESGFAHTAFAFGYEAGISKSPIDGNLVPPEALVKFVQKGAQYMEMEANLTNDDVDVDEDFSLLQPLDLIRKDVIELYKIMKDRKKNQQEARGRELDRGPEGESVRMEDQEDGKHTEKQDTERERGNDKDRVENDNKRLRKRHDDQHN